MKPFNFKNPSVKLVGVYDGRAQAWRHSRPHLDPNDPVINSIEKVNLPVNGFAVYQFEITSSLLLRDILYMIRPSNDWARSNRTTLITEDNLFYSNEYKELIEGNEEALEYHKRSVNQAVNQDIRKSNFLYAVSTDYSYMINARVLSNLLWSLNNTVLKPYADLFMNELNEAGINLVPHEDFSIFESLRIPKHLLDFEGVKVDYSEDNELVTITADMTGNLNSQFERQESGIVKSSLVNNLMKAKELTDLPLSQANTVVSQLILNRDRAIKLVRTRSCWFAQYDRDSKASWSRIVSAVIHKLNLIPNECLICKGDPNKCKWKAEQLARLKAGNPNGSVGEVNPPCPILTGIPEMQILRGLKFNSDSELYYLWNKFCQSNKEITQEGIEYLNNVNTYGYAEKRDNEALKEFTNNLLIKYKDYLHEEKH